MPDHQGPSIDPKHQSIRPRQMLCNFFSNQGSCRAEKIQRNWLYGHYNPHCASYYLMHYKYFWDDGISPSAWLALVMCPRHLEDHERMYDIIILITQGEAQ